MTTALAPARSSAPAGSDRSAGPLRRVLQALQVGADSRADLAEHTGLDPEIVDAALTQLIRLGRVQAEALGSGCPSQSQGCGGCPSASAVGPPACLVAGAARSTKLVAIRLVSRPPA